jgi:hypothetical protein
MLQNPNHKKLFGQENFFGTYIMPSLPVCIFALEPASANIYKPSCPGHGLLRPMTVSGSRDEENIGDLSGGNFTWAVIPTGSII